MENILKKKKFISIRIKLTVVLSTILVFFILTSSFIYIKQHENDVKQEMLSNLKTIKEGVKSKGHTLTRAIGLSCSTALAEYNFSFLQSIIDSIIQHDNDAVYGIIMNAKRQVFIHSDKKYVGKLLNGEIDKKVSNFKAKVDEIKDIEYETPEGKFLEIVYPIILDTDKWGTLRIGLSLQRFHAEKQQALFRLHVKIRTMWVISISIMIGFIFFGILISLLISQRIAIPIKKLSEQAKFIAAGDFSKQIPSLTSDEIGILANQFDKMRISINHMIENLQIIHKTGRELSAIMDMKNLLEYGGKALCQKIGIETGIVYLFDSSKELIPTVSFGDKDYCTIEHSNKLVESLNKVQSDKTSVSVKDNDFGKYILNVPLLDSSNLSGIISISKPEPFREYDIEFSETIANSMSISLKNINLLSETAIKARMDIELNTARIVQEAFFPKEKITYDGWDISYYNISATETGGDWFGFLNDIDGSKVVILGDVTGHGVPSALVTAGIFSTYKSIQRRLENNPSNTPLSTNLILKELDDIVCAIGQGNYCMTCFVLKITTEGKIFFSNAGHNFPIFIRKQEKHKIKSLLARGNRLGFYLDNIQNRKIVDEDFDERTDMVCSGDFILLYTDGLIECKNSNNQQYGKKRLFRLIKNNFTKSADEFKNILVKDVKEFYNNNILLDDIALVILKKN